MDKDVWFSKTWLEEIKSDTTELKEIVYDLGTFLQYRTKLQLRSMLFLQNTPAFYPLLWNKMAETLSGCDDVMQLVERDPKLFIYLMQDSHYNR